MKINFYTDNEQKAPTVGNFLFTNDYAEIMQGQRIKRDEDIYQVNSLEWNEDGTILNAFIWKYPQKTRISELQNEQKNIPE